MSGEHRRLFKGTVNELQQKIDDYFIHCDKNKIPYTVTDLALFLGFNSRQDFINYKDKYSDSNGERYFDTIKKARTRIEASLERRLSTGRRKCSGANIQFKE